MSGFAVIDSSIALKLVIKEPDSAQARALLESWRADEVLPAAPFLLPIEATNGIYQHVRQNELEFDEAVVLLGQLVSAGIELLAPAGMHRRAMEIAHRFGQGAVYDAHYLALAEALDCEMWTADTRFYRAVRGAFQQVRLLSEAYK